MDQYSAEVAQHTIDVRSLIEVRRNFETTLMEKNSELAETRRLRSTLANQMAADERSFTARTNDLNSGITVIDKALQLLASARSTVLAEVGADEYRLTAESMHRTLGQMQLFYEPIAKVLLSMGTE